MIEYLKGEIIDLTPTIVVIDCSGVGYAVNTSLNTYSAIQGKNQCKLYIYEVIREDAHILYGFFDKQERELFLQLISVPGIGGNTARTILSTLPPSELYTVITEENAAILKAVKGIGLKTAQRIIVELKDKIKYTEENASAAGVPFMNNAVLEEAVTALNTLGFPAAASRKAVTTVLKEEPQAPVEKVIKLALKRL
ncbi:MAG: Holliday junction branch migration protein RuvA [Mediterranea sp.]|jgi:Holliday junction DNA helicase RuvA|nr:Holliday junction branch migration protein RuvA [Mediterranea sp.]